MALDYSKLSDDELDAIANNDYSRLSDATLDTIANAPAPESAPTSAAGTNDLAASAVQTGMSAGMSMGPTGLKELGQAGLAAAKPLAQATVAGPIAAYAANPARALAVDAVSAVATGGLPLGSAYQSIKSFPEKYRAAVEAGKEVGKFTSQSALTPSPVTGNLYPESVPDFRAMQKANPAIAQKLSEVYQTGGGNNAVKAFLSGPEGQAAMRDPRFAAAAESYMGKVPGVMGQVGRVAGPIARGALKALGPVGMGMNLYDAGQMARETELGSRLQQGQGQQAEQAFRAGPVQSYQGPQLNPQEQQNVMTSGSARDKQYFNDQMNMAVRLKAAKKVLGQ